MEKESKVLEKETEKEIIDEAVVVEEKALTLFVERESFKGKDNKEYWAYVIKGNVRGREIKVDFIPKDKGGYEPLDILFEISDKAELIMNHEQMKDSSGHITRYVSYKVRTVDEDGVVFECGVKPARDSDKALLNMLINCLNK